MEIRLASPLELDSVINGEGLRMVIWTQGCPHRCEGCHNPSTWKYTDGFLQDIDDLIREILNNGYHTGITFSGGEPFLQVKECLCIAKVAVMNNLTIWCYTGYTLEQLLEKNDCYINEFLKLIDVLVDGKFIKSEASLALPFRGSKNQRCLYLKEMQLT